MLDAFIIEEIRRRERLRRQEEERERPFVELPLPEEPLHRERPKRRTEREDDRPNRGVVVIDMAV